MKGHDKRAQACEGISDASGVKEKDSAGSPRGAYALHTVTSH